MLKKLFALTLVLFSVSMFAGFALPASAAAPEPVFLNMTSSSDQIRVRKTVIFYVTVVNLSQNTKAYVKPYFAVEGNAKITGASLKYKHSNDFAHYSGENYNDAIAMKGFYLKPGEKRVLKIRVKAKSVGTITGKMITTDGGQGIWPPYVEHDVRVVK